MIFNIFQSRAPMNGRKFSHVIGAINPSPPDLSDAQRNRGDAQRHFDATKA
jgi:hypothetical protein